MVFIEPEAESTSSLPQSFNITLTISELGHPQMTLVIKEMAF